MKEVNFWTRIICIIVINTLPVFGHPRIIVFRVVPTGPLPASVVRTQDDAVKALDRGVADINCGRGVIEAGGIFFSASSKAGGGGNLWRISGVASESTRVSDVDSLLSSPPDS